MKIIDAYDGKTKALLGNYQNTAQLPLNAVFSPDGATVACGTEDGFIHLWESEVFCFLFVVFSEIVRAFF